MIEQLTRREREVLGLIVAGQSTKAVAERLGISFKTAACHRYHLLEKTGAQNTAALVRLAVQNGWVDGAEKAPTSPSPHTSDSPGLPDLELRVSRLCETSRQQRDRLQRAVAELSGILEAGRAKQREIGDACRTMGRPHNGAPIPAPEVPVLAVPPRRDLFRNGADGDTE